MRGGRAAGAAAGSRPTRLAGLPGLANVAVVAPGIYRGSAPSARGLDSLKEMGIKTVVNLRHYSTRT